MEKSKVGIDQITCSECNTGEQNVEKKEPLHKKSKEGTYATLFQISDDANRNYHLDIFDIISSFKNTHI